MLSAEGKSALDPSLATPLSLRQSPDGCRNHDLTGEFCNSLLSSTGFFGHCATRQYMAALLSRWQKFAASPSTAGYICNLNSLHSRSHSLSFSLPICRVYYRPCRFRAHLYNIVMVARPDRTRPKVGADYARCLLEPHFRKSVHLSSPSVVYSRDMNSKRFSGANQCFVTLLSPC